jgi:CheY-like chemotaxis protein
VQDDEEVEVPVDFLRPGMALSRDLTDINGVTLLKAKTVLDAKVIEKVLRQEEFDLLLSRIYIFQNTLPHEDAEETEQTSPPGGIQSWRDAQTEAEGKNTVKRADEIARQVVETAKEIVIEEARLAPEKPKIIVVDDQQHIVQALNRELRSGGYDVCGFTNANTALTYIRKEKDIYAVISDYLMPGVRGDKFVEVLQEERPEIPCIIITGQATHETIYNLTKSGHVVRILPKPWDKEALLKTLGELAGEIKQPV